VKGAGAKVVINLATGRPICFKARRLDEDSLVPNARLAGATPLWEWIGEGATVFSY